LDSFMAGGFVNTPTLQPESRKYPVIGSWLFSLLLLLILTGAIVRSAIATRLDDFTIDEAYHIAAGVSYVERADFRLNPEHPPLVKLWVGGFMSATGFHLSAFREIHDKNDERAFTEGDVFLHNDPDSVQRRSRIAMWLFSSVLLVLFALTIRRAFGPWAALGTALFLAIDPTIAAYLPLVMTDLPISLLGATAVVLGATAFRTWLWKDLAACSIALGLALGAKHSGLVFFAFLALTGALLAILLPLSGPADSRLRRFGKVVAVLLGALIILWSHYFFHFKESRGTTAEAFNRPLVNKIEDIHSPLYRFALRQMDAAHIVPRAYIWGLADTIRAGMEGRAQFRLAFGRLYYKRAPIYFFPGVIAVKLPIGLSVLVLMGLALFFARRLPREWIFAVGIVLLASICFLVVLSFGSSYGGIRHALPVVVLLAVMGGITTHAAVSSNSKLLRAVVAVAFLAAAASALPVMRPWEYYNEIVGGGKNAYLYFDDEGIDVNQRDKEIIRYYHQVLQPAGELPYLGYGMSEAEAKARSFDFVGFDLKRDAVRLNSTTWSGTIFIGARDLGRKLWWDVPTLRAATPVIRLGNLLVLRGSFDLPGGQAEGLYSVGIEKLYAEKPDLETAEHLLKRSAALDPTAFFVNIELGNLCLKRGSREDALRAYTTALQFAPNDPTLRHSIEEQIARVASQPLQQISTLRNPQLE
jgi:Dolichyl-phosphate-mannose-protein mannosyltransferase